MSYSIVSGYHCRPNSGLDWFYPIWWANTLKDQPKANKVFVIAMSGCRIPGAPGDWIHLDADAQCSWTLAGRSSVTIKQIATAGQSLNAHELTSSRNSTRKWNRSLQSP